MSHEHVLERSNLSLVVLECKLESHIGDHDAERTYAHASTDGKQANEPHGTASATSITRLTEVRNISLESSGSLVWVWFGCLVEMGWQRSRSAEVCRGLPRSLG